MTSGHTTATPVFSWTEDERALLRRTLSVEELTDERITVEADELGVASSLYLSIQLAGEAVIAAGLVAYLTASATPEGLRITIWPFLCAAWLISMSMRVAFSDWPSETRTPISFFPRTSWFVHQTPVQSKLGILARTEVGMRPVLLGGPLIPLESDIGRLHLRTALWASTADKVRTRKLILDRCVPSTPRGETIPEHVVRLVGPEVSLLSRTFYAPLQRYLDVVSVASNALTVRTETESFLRSALAITAEVLLFLFLVLLTHPTAGTFSGTVTLGGAELVPLWRLLLFVGLLAPGPMLIAVQARRQRAKGYKSITISKDAAHIAMQNRLAEQRIPANECTLSAKLDRWSREDEGRVPTSIFLHHREKILTKWVLDHPAPSETEQRALVEGLRSYLDSAKRVQLTEKRSEEG